MARCAHPPGEEPRTGSLTDRRQQVAEHHLDYRRRASIRMLLAIPFGVGLALVLDEFALLLELKDVYWAQDGRKSVDVAFLVAALLLVYYVAQCFWHDLVVELRRGLGHIRR